MKNDFKKHLKWLLLYVFFIIVLAFLINFLLYLPIPSVSPIDSSHWLGFWGNFLGSIIACIPAILALYESRRQSEQQHEEVQEQLEESRRQAKQIQLDSMESRRCSVLPLVDLTLIPIGEYPNHKELSDYFSLIYDDNGIKQSYLPNLFDKNLYTQNQGRCFTFYVRNIGLGPAIEATITNNGIEFFHGEVSTTLDVKSILIVSPPKDPKNFKKFDFIIQYQDVFSNLYERRYILTWTLEGFTDSVSTPPKLIKRFRTPLC